MATEIRVPNLGESIVEATVGQWFKQAGDTVSAAEPLVELETDKVTVEVPAPASGVLAEIAVKTGETVPVGALLGAITDGKAKPAKANGARVKPAKKPAGKSAAAKKTTPNTKTTATKKPVARKASPAKAAGRRKATRKA